MHQNNTQTPCSMICSVIYGRSRGENGNCNNKNDECSDDLCIPAWNEREVLSLN